MPFTQYPAQLAQYLYHRFDMEAGQKILDVGCGRAEYLKGFHKMGMIGYGVDGCRVGLVQEGIYISRQDIAQGMQYKAEDFDFIFAKSILEHLYKPEEAVVDCQRMLKVGGTMIVMVPDWRRCYKSFYGDYGHKTPFTASSIRDMMDVAGFDDIHVEDFYQVPLLWAAPWLRLPLQVAALFPFKSTTIRFSNQPMLLAWGTKTRPTEMKEASYGL